MSRVLLRPKFDITQPSKEVKGDWTKETLDTSEAYKFLQAARDELLQLEIVRNELKKTKSDLKYQQYRNSLLFEEVQRLTLQQKKDDSATQDLEKLKVMYNELVEKVSIKNQRNELSDRIKELIEIKTPRRTKTIKLRNL